MEIDKTILNAIRGVFRREISKAKSVENIAKKNLNLVSSLLNKSASFSEKIESIKLINSNFNTSFSIFANGKDIIIFFNDIISRAERYSNKVRIMMRSFDKSGINCVTYSFPLFCSLGIDDSPFLNYLSLMGIKYNGTHEKNLNLMDEFEIKLNKYEKEMAKYIQENYTIIDYDIEKFKELYEEYIRYYFKFNSDYVKIDENGIQAILNGMNFYLRQNVSFVESCIRIQNESKKIEENLLSQRSSEFHPQSDIYPEEYCSVEPKKLSKKELLENRRKEQLEKIATPDELENYNYAKNSGIIEVTKIKKEIDAIIDLLLDETDESEKEYLNNECKGYFNRLANLLNNIDVVDEQDQDLYDLYFSTNNFENVEKCWFIKDLSDVREESLNNILKHLELLKKGLLSKSKIKSLKGQNGFKEIKDDQIRIVYKLVQERTFVILGVFIKKADNDIETYRKIVDRSLELSSKEYSEDVFEYFKSYVEENARFGSRR